jgi:hypothetical protein
MNDGRGGTVFIFPVFNARNFVMNEFVIELEVSIRNAISAEF